MTRRVEGEDWLTVRAAAQALGVHENTIRNWCDEGVLEYYRMPGAGQFRRISRAQVERMLNERERDENERRWAIKKILIDYQLHCEDRHRRERTELAWPTVHDIADRAIDRLDRLYTGTISPAAMMEECEESEWTPSPPGYEIVEIDIRREDEK